MSKDILSELIPSTAMTTKFLLVMPVELKQRLVAVQAKLESLSEYDISMTELVLLAVDEYLTKAESMLE